MTVRVFAAQACKHSGILNIIVTGVSPYAFVVGFWPLKFWPRPSDTSNKCPVKSFETHMQCICVSIIL